MTFIKKQRYEQHDNEKGSFYKSVTKPFDQSLILDSDIDCEICVIGGGLTGISSSIYLAKKGYSVSLFEAKKIGHGASGRNGGQLGIGMRKDQKSIEKIFGFEHANKLWNLGLEAVTEAKKLISEYKIECNLVNGVINAGFFEKDEKDFTEEVDHMQNKYGFKGYQYLNKKEISDELSTDIYHSGLLNKYSYHINPLKFLIGLANELKSLNVKVYENTPITKILNHKDGVKLFSNSKTVNARRVVVGCNGYLDSLLGNIRNKFMPINNYIIATEPLGKDLAEQIIKNNYAVSDTRFIIDYYRFSEDWRMLFGGGETYTSKFITNPENFVRKRMLKVFPQLKKYKIDFAWGGTLAITVNRLPDFGTLMNDKIIYAHGYSGHGLALSTLSGKLIAEKISGESNKFDIISKIKNFSIPGGDFLRRPIYTSAVGFYKFQDMIKSINR